MRFSPPVALVHLEIGDQRHTAERHVAQHDLGIAVAEIERPRQYRRASAEMREQRTARLTPLRLLPNPGDILCPRYPAGQAQHEREQRERTSMDGNSFASATRAYTAAQHRISPLKNAEPRNKSLCAERAIGVQPRRFRPFSGPQRGSQRGLRKRRTTAPRAVSVSSRSGPGDLRSQPEMSARRGRFKIAHQIRCGVEYGANNMKIAQIAPLYESCPPQLLWRHRAGRLLSDRGTGPARTRGHAVRQRRLAHLGASGAGLRSSALRLDQSCKDPLVYHLSDAATACARRADEFDILHFHTDYLHFPLFRRLLAQDADDAARPARSARPAGHDARNSG